MAFDEILRARYMHDTSRTLRNQSAILEKLQIGDAAMTVLRQEYERALGITAQHAIQSARFAGTAAAKP